MSYAPDPLVHVELSDRADLYCSACGQYCSQASPCLHCTTVSMQDVPAAFKAKPKDPEPETRLIEDGDFGVAGDSHG